MQFSWRSSPSNALSYTLKNLRSREVVHANTLVLVSGRRKTNLSAWMKAYLGYLPLSLDIVQLQATIPGYESTFTLMSEVR